MAQQGLDRLVPDPLDLLQFAVDKRLAAFLPVEGNGETVHLLLNVRQKVEQGRSGTDADQQGRESAEQFGRAVTVVLGQSGDGYVQPEAFQLFNSSVAQW